MRDDRYLNSKNKIRKNPPKVKEKNQRPRIQIKSLKEIHDENFIS